MTGDIEIHGYAEAIRLMSQLTDQMQRTLVRQALRRSAQPIVATARARAPHRTGRLKRSIGVVSLRRDRVPTVIPMAVGPVFSVTKNGKANAFYARFVHDGTKERKPYAVSRNSARADRRDARRGIHRARVLKFTGREGGTVYTPTARGMKPNPFLRKAFDLSSDVTVANFGRELETVIARFVNRNFRKL